MGEWRVLAERCAALLPRRHGLVAAVLGLILLDTIVLLWPRHGRLRELWERQERAWTQVAMSKAAARQSSSADALATRPGAEGEGWEIASASNDADPLPALAVGVEAAGLRLERVERRPDRSGDGYSTSVTTLELQGSFAQLLGFLAWLESSPRLFVVDSLALRASRGREGNDASLHIVCDVLAHRWLPDTVRESGPNAVPEMLAEGSA